MSITDPLDQCIISRCLKHPCARDSCAEAIDDSNVYVTESGLKGYWGNELKRCPAPQGAYEIKFTLCYKPEAEEYFTKVDLYSV